MVVIVRTLPCPSTLAHVLDVQQFIRSHIARMIYTAVPLLLDFPKRRRAKRKVNILEMPSARFIGERVVGDASFINKVFFLQWHVRNINRFIWREKETAPVYT